MIDSSLDDTVDLRDAIEGEFQRWWDDGPTNAGYPSDIGSRSLNPTGFKRSARRLAESQMRNLG